jgi:REP element-mobilizing transposase RayT
LFLLTARDAGTFEAILLEAGYACKDDKWVSPRFIAIETQSTGFCSAAWAFLPDHWHAIFYRAHPFTISRVMESIKDAATKRINRSPRERGTLLQPRFFDRALRTVSEYNEKVEYIHLNPVKAGLVNRREDWPWSSVHDYTGSVLLPAATPGGLSVDRVLLPADESTRI